jgi:hypothetical protein
MANPTPTQIFPAPADSDPPTIRCKKCKVPLPDATWKNCDNCRRHRTESYNRWKKSVEARRNIAAASSSSLPLEAQSSSAPAPRRDSTDVAPNRAYYKTSSQASTPSVTHQFPSARDNNGSETAASRTNATTNQPRMTSTSAVPPESIHVPEFQWSDELVDHLLELPPRSTFLGKFSVIADPMVSNGSRAYMFIDQLRARELPISYASSLSSAFCILTPTRVRVRGPWV